MPTTAYPASFVKQYSSFYKRKISANVGIQEIIDGLNNEFSLLTALITAGSYTAITQSQDPRISAISLNTSDGYTKFIAGTPLSGVSISPTSLATTTSITNPVKYSAQFLPTWASLDSTTGDISGTPVALSSIFDLNNAVSSPGVGNEVQKFIVDAVDSFGNSACGPQLISITVVSALSPVVTSASTAAGTAGAAFSYQITASHTPTSFGLLDDSTTLLTVDASGLVSCAALPIAGSYAFTVFAANQYGESVNLVVTLTVS